MADIVGRQAGRWGCIAADTIRGIAERVRYRPAMKHVVNRVNTMNEREGARAGARLVRGGKREGGEGRSGAWVRMWVIAASHGLVDVYAAFLIPILGILQVRCELEDRHIAWLIAISSVAGGIFQPVVAWVSDRTDSRVYAGLGLAGAGVCMSLIGWPTSFWGLAWLVFAGTFAVGMYHPVGAASMGQLSAGLEADKRTLGVSVFHVAGMAGGFAGSILVSRMAGMERGLEWLKWGMIPGILLGVVLHMAIRGVPHRHEHARRVRFGKEEIRRRWKAVGMLYAANAMRFTVNTMLAFLFVKWAHELTAEANPALMTKEVAQRASKDVGNLNAMMVLGMGAGAMGVTALVKRGREKGVIVYLPVVLAPAIGVMGDAGMGGGFVLAALAGAGFAGMIPATISVAQRLLPHRTSLASGLMMGGAWGLAAVGPVVAEWWLNGLGMSLRSAFWLTAGLQAASGVLCWALDERLMGEEKRGVDEMTEV